MNRPQFTSKGAAGWPARRSSPPNPLVETTPPEPAGRDEPDSAKGADVLDAVAEFIDRFVAFPSQHHLVVVTLWAAMTHALEAFHTTPRLALLSPEPESGKTTVLEVLDQLTADPMSMINPTPASLFRSVEHGPRTLLIDEADNLLAPGPGSALKEVQALLNTGYKRGAKVPRCVPPAYVVREIPVFAPVGLAGLGELPPALATRSITIRMQRRLPEEVVQRFIPHRCEEDGARLRAALRQWLTSALEELAAADPDFPEGIADRQAECWEPLLAIADAAGGRWPGLVRRACSFLATDRGGTSGSSGIALLRAVRRVWEQAGEPEKMRSSNLVEAVDKIPSPEWRPHFTAIDEKWLAAKLKPYGVAPTKYREGDKTMRGYKRSELQEAFARYLRDDEADVS